MLVSFVISVFVCLLLLFSLCPQSVLVAVPLLILTSICPLCFILGIKSFCAKQPSAFLLFIFTLYVCVLFCTRTCYALDLYLLLAPSIIEGPLCLQFAPVIRMPLIWIHYASLLTRIPPASLLYPPKLPFPPSPLLRTQPTDIRWHRTANERNELIYYPLESMSMPCCVSHFE